MCYKNTMLLRTADKHTVKLEESDTYPNTFFSPEGFCRVIDKTLLGVVKCTCTVVHALRDGSCPCAPHDMSNPIVTKWDEPKKIVEETK